MVRYTFVPVETRWPPTGKPSTLAFIRQSNLGIVRPSPLTYGPESRSRRGPENCEEPRTCRCRSVSVCALVIGWAAAASSIFSGLTVSCSEPPHPAALTIAASRVARIIRLRMRAQRSGVGESP
jgi:hypothetical protein